MYCKDASSNIQQQINTITSNPIFGNVAPNIGISVFTQNVVFQAYTTFNGAYNYINGGFNIFLQSKILNINVRKKGHENFLSSIL